jgi:cell division ATPase FtsA
MSGKELKFDFVALTCSEKQVNQFIDLLASLKLKVMRITNNSLCLASILTKRNDLDNIVIDIKSKNIVLNLYDSHGKIRNITSLSYGTNHILQTIRTTFGIPASESLTPIFNVIKTCKSHDDLALINVYDERFLLLKEATAQNIQQVSKSVIQNVFTDIEKIVIELRNKYATNFTQINLNVNDDVVDLFNCYCPEVIGNGLIINLIKNDVIGLEDYNANNILSAMQYVYNEQTKINQYIYSIDAYISEEINNEQVKRSA